MDSRLGGARDRRWLVPYAVLFLSLGLTGAVAAYTAHSARAQHHLEFDAAAQSIRAEVQTRLETYLAMLLGARGLFAASKEVTREEFQIYVDHLALRTRYPGIQGIGFSQRVLPEQRDEVERVLHEQLPTRGIWPATPRDEVHAIIYLEPQDRRNAAALGYDMSTEPVRWEAMSRARDTGLPAMSGKVTLVQEIDPQKQAGFLIYTPVYRPGLPNSTVAERRAALKGFVYAPFRVDDLLQGALDAGAPQDLALEVFDGLVPVGDARMHCSHPEADTANAPKVITVLIEVAGRAWTLRFTDLEVRAALLATPWSASLLGLGTAISVLFFLLTRAQVRARATAEHIAGELRESEHALRASEVQLRLVADALPVLIAHVDPGGRYRFVNQAYGTWFDTPTTELVGHHVSRAVGVAAFNVMQPYMDRALHGERVEFEAEVPYPHGTRHVRTTLVPQLDESGHVDGYVSLVADITPQKQAEARIRALNTDLQRRLDELQTILDVAPVGLAIARDPQCHRIDVNAHISRLLGLPPGPGDSLGAPPAEAPRIRVRHAGRELAPEEKPLQVAAARGVTVTDMELDLVLEQDGRVVTVLVSAVPLFDENGRTRGAIGVMVDITGRKRDELERTRLLHAEQAAREKVEHLAAELQQAVRARDEFLAIASHELRTPITSLQLYVQSMVRTLHRAPSVEPNLLRGMESAERQVVRLEHLIRNLLDISRLTSGRLHLELEELDLAALSREVVTRLKVDAARAGCTLSARIPDEPVFIRADRLRMEQVLGNLLSNAFKYGAGKPVEVELTVAEKLARVSVTDHGIGIAPEDQERIFQRFERAVSERHYGGFGLGLWIVRQILNALGGEVRLQSTPGQGSTFTIEIGLV
ncbi:MAG: CHASE domain-containing protein [Myxococcota bacterium]